MRSFWQMVCQMMTMKMYSARRRQNNTHCCSHSRRRSLEQSQSCRLWHRTPPSSTQVLTHAGGGIRMSTDMATEQS